MPRYFIEVFYKGTNYSGFQKQQNANTIQAEIEKALYVFYKEKFTLTGSSRTDAGVHALQNFFHFDTEKIIADVSYQLNAILPNDIGVKKIFSVKPQNHCRFDAIYREYNYYIYQQKNPFVQDTAYYYPYLLNMPAVQAAAAEVIKYNDFAAFSKTNTQTKTTICNLLKSNWKQNEFGINYQVISNRFLRGMVKGLVGTMLQVGRGKITVDEFIKIIKSKDSLKANFSVPSHGLFLSKVNF